MTALARAERTYREMRTTWLHALRAAFEADRAATPRSARAARAFCDQRLALIARILKERP
jgi:hypothetical protein